MQEKRVLFDQTQPSAQPSIHGAKRLYREPELIVWGSITHLTRGMTLGGQDFPGTGGTAPTFAPPGDPPKPGGA